MSDPADLPNNPSLPPRDSGQNALRTDRRRLLQGGLAAAPVLMTLVSRPVLGATCVSTSGMASGNTSHPGKHLIVCNGFTSGFWKQEQNFGLWPSPYVPGTVPVQGGDARKATTSVQVQSVGARQPTKFHPTFAGSQFGAKTLLEVLDPSTADSAGLGRHIVAALLNAQSGRTPVLSAPAVRNIWAECTAKGYFEPTAGVRWYPREVVKYLKTTMPS